MKVHVNGYGLLPFRATECYKINSIEDLVQFRGEVKLPDVPKWLFQDYWYAPTDIVPTITAPSEAVAFKQANDFVTGEILKYLFGEECGAENCTNPNCSCKKVDGLYKPTGLTENSVDANNSGPVNNSAETEKVEPTFEEQEIERVKKVMQTLDLNTSSGVSEYKSLLNLYQQLKEIYLY